MSEIKHTPVTDDTFIMGYKVGAGLHGTIEDANKAIRRGEGDSWIPLYRKNHAGAELLEALYGIRRYGLDTLSGRADGGPDDREWQREAVNEMTKRARIAIEKATGAA